MWKKKSKKKEKKPKATSKVVDTSYAPDGSKIITTTHTIDGKKEKVTEVIPREVPEGHQERAGYLCNPYVGTTQEFQGSQSDPHWKTTTDYEPQVNNPVEQKKAEAKQVVRKGNYAYEDHKPETDAGAVVLPPWYREGSNEDGGDRDIGIIEAKYEEGPGEVEVPDMYAAHISEHIPSWMHENANQNTIIAHYEPE